MRERNSVVIHRNGCVDATQERLSDASLDERIAELKASIPQAVMQDCITRFLTILCDGCGASEQVDFDKPSLPEGWVESDKGELCPVCK